MQDNNDYLILVRSYKRPHQIFSHSLKFLRENNLLDRTVVLVADESEHESYATEREKHPGFLEVRFEITAKGAAASYTNFLKGLDVGRPVFMMDDDIKEFYEYTDINDSKTRRPIRNFGEYLLYGFDLLKKTNSGAFSFDYKNPFYKKGSPFVKIGMFRICGGFFGAFNNPTLWLPEGVEHDEDNYRTSAILEQFGKNLIFNWFEVKMAPIGKNPGGMNADGSRDNTKKAVASILEKYPIVSKYYEEVPVDNDTYNMTTLKYKHTAKLKKLSNYSAPIKIYDSFGKLNIVESIDVNDLMAKLLSGELSLS